MTRTATPVDALAEHYMGEVARQSPIQATYWGIPGGERDLPDLSPDGLAAASALRRDTLTGLAATPAQDATDAVTVAALRSRLEIDEAIRETGADEATLGVIGTPLQHLRQVFDMMPTATEADWDDIAARMAAMPAAIEGYVASLRLAAERGDTVPARQVRAAHGQALDSAAFFAKLAGTALALPPGLREDLDRAADVAGEAYAGLAGVLHDELLPLAPERDAVGRERYALFSPRFLGARVDLDDAYAWGIEEVAQLREEMARTAVRIAGEPDVGAAKAVLDADPVRRVFGRDGLQAWMQERSDEAVAALSGAHFDIPEAVRTLECRIAPMPTGGIYYTGPSDDLSRPGRMWWTVPDGVDSFATWRDLTTVYHEGVPGHHLQIARTTCGRLNRWRRQGSWLSGHGEGWALYAERLMAELGYLDDPGDYLGMLDGQLMRAARVVIDIGVHCDLPHPDGGTWSYDRAWDYLTANSSMSEPMLRFELDRYLGWPGQAPAYKLGERLWLSLRDEVRAQQGAAFDLAAFHGRALDVGSVGMDVLRSAVLAASHS